MKISIKNFIKKVNDMWNKFINLKFIRTIFLFLPHNFFLLLFFCVSFFLLVKLNLQSYTPLYTHEAVPDSSFEPILTEPLVIDLNTVKEEKIEKSDNDINSICLLFATYTRKTNSIYQFTIYKNDEIVYEQQFNTHILTDGKYSCFSFPGVTKENVHEYKVEIKPIQTGIDNVITIFKNSTSGEALFQLAHTQEFFSVRTIICLAFLICFFGINLLINTKKLKVQHIWLLVAFIYILPITFIIPPYEVPDEPRHFYTAYRLTQYDFNQDFYTNMVDMNLVNPKNLDCIGYSRIQFRDKILDFNDIKECFKNGDNEITRSPYDYVGSKIAYFVSALGLKLADIFTNSPMFIFFMGRLCNTLFSIFLIYKAIKIAPKHKELLLVGATIPMFVQQMASYSYDSFLNSFSILAIAIILKMIYEEQLNLKKWTSFLLLCGLFIAAIKWNYLFIFALILLIPDEKWNRKIDKYIYCFTILVSSYLLGIISNSIFIANSLKIVMNCLFTLIAIGVSTYGILNKKSNIKVLLPILIVSLFGISFTNPIYLPIPLFICLFYPSSENSKTKDKIIKYACIVLAFIIIYFLGHYIISCFNKATNINNTISESNASIFTSTFEVLKEPKKMLHLFINTLKLRGMFYIQSLIGYFGWFVYKLSDFYIYVYLLFAIYLICKSTFVKTHWYEKSINLAGIGIGCVGIFLAMYFSWSSHSIPYIDGIQGRYFIPFVIPLLLLCMTARKKGERNLSQNTYNFVNTILMVTTISFLLFYY